MPERIFYGHQNVKVSIQPNIGLEASARQAVINVLNVLLADETVLSLKISKVGEPSPTLLTVFNPQNQKLKSVIDELAERVQIMGGAQPKEPGEWIEQSRLGIGLNNPANILNILADHEALIRFLREDARLCAELYEDQGTSALLVEILRAHEKMAWILRKNISFEQYDP